MKKCLEVTKNIIFQEVVGKELQPKKIASIRKEIAINVKNGMSVEEARRQANLKYGKGWRERGLISNSDNQWTAEDLQPYL